MKRIWAIIFGMLGVCSAEAQVFHERVKSAYITGGAYSEQFTDAFSFTGNPAVLGTARSGRLALSAERRWMLKELDYYQLAGSFPAGSGGIGFQFHYTGDADYNESALAMAYGKNLGSVSLGLQLRYEVYHAAGYGNKPDGSVTLGLRFHPAEKLYAGLVFSSTVFERKEQANPEKGPGDYIMGFGYEASAGVLISIQFIKEAGIPLNLIGCIDYRWSDQFFASLGMETNSASPYIKAGWRKNQLTIEWFTAYHAALGFTPGLVLLWEGKKKSG